MAAAVRGHKASFVSACRQFSNPAASKTMLTIPASIEIAVVN